MLAGFLAAAVLLAAPFAQASDWDGLDSVWSSNASPGWNGTGVPNLQGAIANNALTSATNVISTQDVAGGVTVGTLSLSGANDNSWSIPLTNPLILDQDAGGAGFATISNSNSSAGAVNVLIVGSAVTQTVTLADNLLISNTGGSTAVNGAIQILPKITGTGNVTLHSDAAIGSPTSTAFPGAIRLQNDSTASTFVGGVLVEKGLVAFSGVSFGNVTNAITLGAAGMGDAAMLSTRTTGVIANPLTVAAGSTGTLTAGSPLDSSFTPFTTASSITLNGDLTLRAGTTSVTVTHTYSGAISGVGGLTKTGSAMAALNAVNTYSGPTNVSAGTLRFTQETALYNATPASWTDTNITVQALASLALDIGDVGDFADASVAQINALGSATGGFQSGSFLGLNPTVASYTYPNAIVNSNSGANSVGLVKIGGNRLITGAANTYTGPSLVLGGTLQFANRNALYGANTANWTDTNLIVAAGTIAAFNVGGAGEFTSADILQISSLGTATGGFLPGASAAVVGGIIGFDTTNAGAEFLYGDALVDLNGGATRLGVRQVGAGTLNLSGNNTYTGQTIVNSGGTIKVTGTHNVTPAAAFNNETGNYRAGTAAGTSGTIILENATINSNFGFMVGESGTGTATMTGGSLTVKAAGTGGGHFFGVGRNTGGVGTFTLNSGTVVVNTDWYVVGVSGTGHGIQNGGSVAASVFAMGQNASGTADYALHDGSISTTGDIYIGLNGKGTVTQDGGSLSAGNVLHLGEGATGEGTYTLGAGGTISTTANITGGVNGKSTFIQTGGSITSGTWYTLGEAPAASGTHTMSGGTLTTATENFVLGFQGKGTVNQTAGDVTVGAAWIMGWIANSTGDYTMDGGSISVTGNFFTGIQGKGTLTQTGGAISIGGFGAVGRDIGQVNTFTKSGGTFSISADLNIGDLNGSKGVLDFTGGDINIASGAFVVGYNTGSTGTVTINGATAHLNNAGTTGGIYIGLAGKGTVNMMNGIMEATDAGGDLRIGNDSGSDGTLNFTGGVISAQDNLWVGLNTGSTGVLNMSGGTLTLHGSDPVYTGSIVLARAGTGTINLSGGAINLVVGNNGTNNSASDSIANSGDFASSQDGNLIIGERTGTGIFAQSGGTLNVAANIFLTTNVSGTGVGTGTFTMTGGTTNVGTTSPTGGDMVIGHVAGSTATVNLQGGLLNVTSGSGSIGAGAGTAAFNFTGGTLRVASFNNTVFGGDLGGLTQNGATSLLDVTANDTSVNGFYTLTAGTASVGPTRVLAVSGNTQVDDTFSTQITGTNIGKMAITGSLTLGAASVLDIQGNLATALTHVIATYNPGSLVGMFGDATDATNNGYNVIYENSQISLDELDGDANHDGVVNIFDINLVSANWDPTGPVAAFAPGNINHDTVVNIFDINQISANWSNVATNGGVPHAQAVPEPSTLALAALALSGLMYTVRRKKS